MHFSIPETQEFYNESTGSTYTGYQIYINGSYHCCLRYKQLHSLHEQLRRQHLPQELPAAFPPKRLLPLTNSQVEQRRAALEHYLQLLGQDPALAKSELLHTFLLNAQLETARSTAAEAERDFPLECCVDVSLMNGYQIQLQCRISDNASALVQKACKCINLTLDLHRFFCLYLMRRESKDTLVLLRRLMDFEAPYISRQQTVSTSTGSGCQLVLRKSYWNPAYDQHLLQDSIGLNLLYIQTMSDVEREWIITTPEMRAKLQACAEIGQKREYLELARKLPLYGCIQFHASNVDYLIDEQQSEGVGALVAIGNKELSMRTMEGPKIYETKFRVTRMRCWRVTAVHHSNGSDSASLTHCIPAATHLQLSFEYLMSKHTLRWITITSAQAMIMSVCLQSMVDELLHSKDANNDKDLVGNTLPSPLTTPVITYVLRDGSGLQTIPSSSATYPQEPNNSSSSSPIVPTRFLAQRRKIKPKSTLTGNNHGAGGYSASSAIVFFRNSPDESVHNEAFEGIGDDEL